MSIIKLSSACCFVTAALAVIWTLKSSPDDTGKSELSSNIVDNNLPTLSTKKDHSVLPSLANEGKDFALYEGIKDVFDALVLKADAQEKKQLQNVAREYCHSEGLTLNGCEQFLEVFGRYVDYKLALADVEAQTVNYSSALQEIEYRLSQINSLKYQFFSEEEIHALFGQEDEIEASALARYKIAKDPTLSREQKLTLLQHHFDSMPDEEKQAFLPSLQIHSLQKIKRMPTTNQHKLELVRAQFGDQAALRLSATWDAQAQFKERLHALTSDYKQVAKHQQQSWLEQHFSKKQAKRARVLLAQQSGNN